MQVDPQECIMQYDFAINNYRQLGHFLTAANIMVDTAEIYEEEKEYEAAMDRYQRAADIYLSEQYVAQACAVK